MIEYKRYQGFPVSRIEEDLRAQGYEPVHDEDQPGFVYEPHSHAEANIIVVLSGEMEVKVGDLAGILHSGDKVTFPANVVHSSHIGSEGCEYLWMESRANVSSNTPGIYLRPERNT